MSDDSILVRASSLTGWPDCERRWAARAIPAMVEDAGFKLRKVPNQIGAKVGTAVHSGAAHMLQRKIDTGELGKRQDATDAAIESLHDEIQMGTSWDETTPTINTAEKQTARMVSIYHLTIAPLLKPVAVELELTARFSPTLRVTGHMDEAEELEIHDTKTGVFQRPNHPQYGTYSLLYRSIGKTVNRFVEDYVPRGSIERPQKEARQTPYPVASCEQAARNILGRIDIAVQAFKRAGDPWSFIPNPASMLCADRFCPAFNTAFCRIHKGAK